MGAFLKAIAGCMIAVVLGTALSKQGKDIWLLLGIAVSCMVAVAAMSFFAPIVEYVENLKIISGIDNQMLAIVIKSAGVGLISEIAGLICTDSGWSGLAKTIQVLSVCVILYLSIPLMSELLEMVQKMVGQV